MKQQTQPRKQGQHLQQAQQRQRPHPQQSQQSLPLPQDIRPMSSSRWIVAGAGLCGFLATAGVAAQTLPDAGSLQREAGRNMQMPQAAPVPQSVPLVKPMPENAKATRITVQRIVIDGASLIRAETLHALIADREGQSLTLAELEHAAQRIAEHYRDQGWYVRVYLPEQDITAGIVHIQVLEGRFGSARVVSQPARADAQTVQNTITHRLQSGASLSAQDLERGLLLANDLPGIQTRGTLQAAQQKGLTDLAIEVQDQALTSSDIGLNNFGSRATGLTQLVGGLALNNLSGQGDQARVRLLATEHTYSAIAGYSLPLGYDGLRLSAMLSALDYKLGKEYSKLNAEGQAQTAGINLSYPLIRQSMRNLYLMAGYEHRRYNDDILGAALHRHQINAITLGLNGDLRDNLGQGGVTWGAITLSSGRLAIKDIASGDKATDAATARTQGSYNKLAWNLSRLQTLAPGWQAQAQLSGQFASKNLASSERFALGGAYRVRAYPTNEGTGDEGTLLQLELHKELAPGWKALAFYDAGTIRQYKDPWAGWNTASGQPNHYTLQGAGLGLSWRQGNWLLNTSLAAPIGHNRGANLNGKNNDGTQSNSLRGWITLSYAF